MKRIEILASSGDPLARMTTIRAVVRSGLDKDCDVFRVRYGVCSGCFQR